MASEYYKKKFQDVKKDEVAELTQKEKFKNWWTYHWFYVMVAVLAVVGVVLVLNQFVFVTRSDYKVMVVGESAAINVDREALSEALAQFGEDYNGDGKVVVKVRSFMAGETSKSSDEEMIALSGDISSGNCQIFIIQDLEWFNEKYGIIDEGNYYKVSDCPALADLDLNGDYYVAIRSYADDGQKKDGAHAQVLWNAMTAGAK